MANIIDADLLIDTLSGEKAIAFLANRLAPLGAFSTDFSNDIVPATKSLQIVKVTAGSKTLQNPTDFNVGDSTTSNIAVTVDAYSQPFHITSKELNQRMRLENLAEANLNELALTLSKVWTALILTTTFTNTGVTVAQSSFSAANAKTLLGSVMKCAQKSLILDGVAFAQLAPSDKNAFQLGETGAYGFQGIHCQTDWTGATANVYGFAAGKQALAMYAGIPLMDPGVAAKLDGQKIMEIPGLGLSVQVNTWVDVNTRARWASYDLAFGAAVAEATALTVVKSA